MHFNIALGSYSLNGYCDSANASRNDVNVPTDRSGDSYIGTVDYKCKDILLSWYTLSLNVSDNMYIKCQTVINFLVLSITVMWAF